MNALIEVKDLRKNFGTVEALKGISLEIPEGICFGILGPNGAGKTTAIEIMEGILTPDKGTVHFRDKQIKFKRSNDLDYKSRIGIQFQHSTLPEYITVEETLDLFSSFYKNSRPRKELIALCSLENIIKRDNRKLSGGQRQRLLLALAIISQPELVFLDEPTTGLDPQARRNFWELIKRIKGENCTVLLTTHYMDEAEILCDQIAIMDKGRILELDSPSNLIRNHFNGVLVKIPWNDIFTKKMGEEVKGVDGIRITDVAMEIATTRLDETVKQLLQANIAINELNINKPNLEDLFIKLTGASLRT